MGNYKSNLNNKKKELEKPSNDIFKCNLKPQRIPYFNGSFYEWFNWKKQIQAVLGICGLSPLMNSRECATLNPALNEKLFFILQIATLRGIASHLTLEEKGDYNPRDGNALWNRLIDWYEGEAIADLVDLQLHLNFESVALEGNTASSSYLNKLNTCKRRYEQFSYSQSTKDPNEDKKEEKERKKNLKKNIIVKKITEQDLGCQLKIPEIPSFHGDQENWLSWKQEVMAILGMCGLLEPLENHCIAKANPDINARVFYLLQVSLLKGDASHLLDEFEEIHDGHSCWKGLIEWFEGDSMMNYLREQLDHLKMEDISASDYINQFLQLKHYLELFDNKASDGYYRHIFLNHIHDKAYESVVNTLKTECNLKKCIDSIRREERNLDAIDWVQSHREHKRQKLEDAP